MKTLPLLNDLVDTATYVVEHAVDKYVPTLSKDETDLVIEMAYAPCTTLTHALVMSKRNEQFAAHPHIKSMVDWISIAGINDLAGRLEIETAEARNHINTYTGLTNDGGYKPEYGLFFLSLMNSRIVPVLRPVKNVKAKA